MNILKKTWSKYSEYRSKKENKYYGTAVFDKLTTNPLPILLVAIFALFLFILSIGYIHYLGDFFYWFVNVLEIPKVLKIPFLEELKNYHYLSLFVYFYLVFSILLDVSNLFIKLSKKSVFLKGEIWQIEQTLFGKELKKYDLSSKELNIRLKHGFLYDYFGLNQIIWEKDNVTVIDTAYFFPYGKNKNIINNLLRR